MLFCNSWNAEHSPNIQLLESVCVSVTVVLICQGWKGKKKEKNGDERFCARCVVHQEEVTVPPVHNLK
jgi:hypothetical protein